MEMLNRLLGISIYSVILFLAIIGIKRVFKNKMSPALHFVIWFLLIARLCVPVTIDSGLRLIVISETLFTQTAAQTQEAAADSQDNPVSYTVEPQTNTNVQNIPQTQQTNTNPTAFQLPSSQSGGLLQWITSMKWTGILIAAWLLGMLLVGTWMIYIVVRMNRIIFRLGIKPKADIRELLEKCKTELGIKRDIPLYLLPKVSTPALTIGFKPKLVLPFDISETLSGQQLEFAIKHELTHYKRKDNITSLLLRILEAVYWFNPVVWLMGKCILSDMETACDSMVVKTLDKQDKKQYVLTLLDMFSQKKAPQFMLGMALNNTEKIAEKRIRGVYMKNKSKRSVKLIAGILAAALIVACFTTACQPTPEESVVVGKNNDNLDSIIAGTPAPAIDTSSTQENETWQEELSGNNVTVNINAEIILPNAAQIPVAEVTPKNLTEEDAWKAIKVFFKDSKIYDEPVYTKEVIEAQIITLKKELADIQNGTIEGDIEDINEQIDYFTELLQTAPSENDVPQSLNDLSFKEQNGREVINVSANIGGNSSPSELLVARDIGSYTSTIYFSNFPESLSRASTTENNMEMTEDQAISLAQSIMSDLGITGMILSGTKTIGSKQEQAYELNFEKNINGICISDYQTHMMTEPEEGESVYAPFLKPEIVTIYINDSGVLEFYCTNPLEIGETINENVSVMNIDEIKDVFKEQVFYNYYADEDYPITINVDRIEFGYFIQSVKDQDGVFRAIPVWDFLAKEGATEGDSYTYSVLTINAIDGSIINRGLGY